MKNIKSFNESFGPMGSGQIPTKQDLSVYRMGLYPDHDERGRRQYSGYGWDQMQSKIRKKLGEFGLSDESAILYEVKEIRGEDFLLVHFKKNGVEYVAKYNHTGNCERVYPER